MVKQVSIPLAWRAFLAIGLMVGFYCLALGVMALLLYLPYAGLLYWQHIHVYLAFSCGLGALIIGWAIFPRIDRFEHPGPRLTQENSPRLFAVLSEVAQAVGQKMPAEVYALVDANVWVSERGGVIGLGSRRVMGLGLPLMQMLRISELRAVLTHEFGHYCGGDTAVGTWVYKTRSAIARTVTAIDNAAGQKAILLVPFTLYGKLFLRVTHAVSRRQEFAADQLAARTVGATPFVNSLRTVYCCMRGFTPYWLNEVAPVLSAGYLPPLAEGFGMFMRDPRVAESMADCLRSEVQDGTADAYDTHPGLRERIEAVAHLPPGCVNADEAQAVSLLEDVSGLEKALSIKLTNCSAQELTPVRWEDVGAQVFLPFWERLLKANTENLKGVTTEAIPGLVRDLKTFRRRFVDIDGNWVSGQQELGLAISTTGAALAILLLREGWMLQALPGSPVMLYRAGAKLEPFNVLRSLVSGTLTEDAWERQCAEIGVAGFDLGL